MLRFAVPPWRQACVALLCTTLLFAIWLPHILRSVMEELKRRRDANITIYASNNAGRNWSEFTVEPWTKPPDFTTLPTIPAIKSTATTKSSTSSTRRHPQIVNNFITTKRIIINTNTSSSLTTSQLTTSPTTSPLSSSSSTTAAAATRTTATTAAETKTTAVSLSPNTARSTATLPETTALITTFQPFTLAFIGKITSKEQSMNGLRFIEYKPTTSKRSLTSTFTVLPTTFEKLLSNSLEWMQPNATQEVSPTTLPQTSTTTMTSPSTIATSTFLPQPRITSSKVRLTTPPTTKTTTTTNASTSHSSATSIATSMETTLSSTIKVPATTTFTTKTTEMPTTTVVQTTRRINLRTRLPKTSAKVSMLTTLLKSTSTVATTTAKALSTISKIAVPLAMASTLAPLAPSVEAVSDGDFEFLPKLMHTPMSSSTTVAKLALALNRINNIPLKWCTPDVEEKYNFNCHRAVRNVGDIRILQRTIMQVVHGTKEKVVFGGVGGSITAGHDVKYHELYVNRMASVFSRAFDVPSVTEIAALPATGSEFFAYCLHKMFDMRRVDILAIEFGINDDRFKDFMPGYMADRGRPMEELVRQVLQYETVQPVMVCFRQVRTLVDLRPDESNYDAECQSIEDTDFLPLAAYYALPLVSWKKVFCRSEFRRNVSQFIAPDGVHPNAQVHEHVGEFFSLLLKYAIEDLIGKLLSRYQPYAQPWNLPRPFTMETAPGLYRSTWIQLRPICYINFERVHSGLSVKTLVKAVTQARNITLVSATGPLNSGEVFEFYEIQSAGSSVTFSFQITNQQWQSMSLAMSLVYSTHPTCSRPSYLRVIATAKAAFPAFSHLNNYYRRAPTFVNSTMIMMPLRCYDGYRANMVDEIPWGPKISFINSLINQHGNLIITIEKTERYYPLSLLSVVAGWRQHNDDSNPLVF